MNKVVACIDGSPSATAVCDSAAWSSLRLETPVELLHVLDKNENPAEGDMTGSIGLGSREALLKELAELDNKRSRLMLEQGRFLLEQAQQRVESHGVTEINTVQRHDSLLDTLKELEDDTRLLIMGRSGVTTGSNMEAIGSQLESAIRTSTRPILVTQPNFTPPEQFLLAYDGSPTSDKALNMVAMSPLLKGVTCHLVMVGTLSEKQQSQLNNAKLTLENAGFKVVVAQKGEDVLATLTTYIEQYQIGMTVMGAYGHSRIRQFLVGSITSQMLQHTKIPLLLLR